MDVSKLTDFGTSIFLFVHHQAETIAYLFIHFFAIFIQLIVKIWITDTFALSLHHQKTI